MTEPDLNTLKAEAYDLIGAIEMAQGRLRQLNQIIAQVQRTQQEVQTIVAPPQPEGVG